MPKRPADLPPAETLLDSLFEASLLAQKLQFTRGKAHAEIRERLRAMIRQIGEHDTLSDRRGRAVSRLPLVVTK